MQRKGIVLAGGHGTRLRPLTNGISKPLLPVYDKPMIYYPLSVLMTAGIREIAIITTAKDQSLFRQALGDGSQWGLSLSWVIQPTADGIAQAYLLAEEFLDGAPSAMVLGDNLFFGPLLSNRLRAADSLRSGGTIFAYEVDDPERYGVVGFDGKRVTSIVEKPAIAPSNYAITGLYFLDGDAPHRARSVRPSKRGELEIVSLLETYLSDGNLRVERFGKDYTWFDAGTHDSLLEAGQAVRKLQKGGKLCGSPDEVAFKQGWSTHDGLKTVAQTLAKTGYGAMLNSIAERLSPQTTVVQALSD
jgi:glucose-1-phosphate thymidylyltransferase